MLFYKKRKINDSSTVKINRQDQSELLEKYHFFQMEEKKKETLIHIYPDASTTQNFSTSINRAAMQQLYEYFLVRWRAEMVKNSGHGPLGWFRENYFALFLSACEQAGIPTDGISAQMDKTSLTEED